MPHVDISDEAEEDLLDIWLWGVDNHGQAQADDFIDEINQTFQKLVAMPYAATERPQLAEGIRSRPFRKKYTIFYKPIESGVLIVRVMRGSRDIEALFGNA